MSLDDRQLGTLLHLIVSAHTDGRDGIKAPDLVGAFAKAGNIEEPEARRHLHRAMDQGGITLGRNLTYITRAVK